MTNKYLRTIYGVDKEGNAGSLQVDVYDILDAYPTKNPALDHLIKKALCPGQRGHKDLLTDLDDIIASAQRAKQMTLNKRAFTTEVTLHASPEDVRDVKAILEGNQDLERIASRQVSTEPPISAAALEEAEPDEPLSGQPARGYKTEFKTRPTSFIEAAIYIIEGIEEGALSRLEHEISQVDVVPDYVLGSKYCPESSIVIWPERNTLFPADSRWHFTVGQAILILINDQKGNNNNV